MTIDDLARDAATELRDGVIERLDTERMLAAIGPASRRRTRLQLASSFVVVLVLALSAAVVVHPSNKAVLPIGPTPTPTTPTPVKTYSNGPILVGGSGGDQHVLASDPDDGHLLGQALTKGLIELTDAAWSHDGSRLAYGAGGGLWVRTVATGVETRIGTCEGWCSPTWSPDDTVVAVGGSSIHLIRLGPPITERKLLQVPDVNSEVVAFSPDGSRLAYVARTPERDAWLGVVDIDGSNPTTLLDGVKGGC